LAGAHGELYADNRSKVVVEQGDFVLPECIPIEWR
jgi:hypothetical protein